MTPTDKFMLNRAAFSGDARTMERAAIAVMAIADCLRSEDINEFQRDGLLVALDIIADDLSERASFLEDKVLGEVAE